MVRYLLATIHLLTLALGLGAVWARGRALRLPQDRAGIEAVHRADNWWGLASLLWIGTGLLRAFAGYEKGTAFYLGSHAFQLKLVLLGVAAVLETWPMITFIRQRIDLSRGREPDTSHTAWFVRINDAEVAVTVLIAAVAVAMARALF